MGILALRDVRVEVNLPVFVISPGSDRRPLDPWFVGMSNAVYLVFTHSVKYNRLARLYSRFIRLTALGAPTLIPS